jgi:D-alanine-D-alanine ligase
MKTVAVIFGGRSAEHDVSIITAHIPIIDTLLTSGQYDVWPVYITKDGAWYCDKQMNDLTFFQEEDWEQKLARMRKVRLSFDKGLTLEWPGFLDKHVKIDVVFPAMHGTYGEDGSLMGVLRMAGVPFVGCDLAASAVAMDKVLTKQVLEAEKIPVVPYVWFTKDQWNKDADAYRKRIKHELKYPLFIKPVHLGSSIGISKAKDEKELENAIEVALHYDDKVLVENGIADLIELTLPIMGNDELRCAEVERPLNKTEFFDFKDKYLSGGGKKGGDGGANNAYSEIPADIGENMTAKVKELGEKVFKTIGLTGIARIDFLVDKSHHNHVYVNEINTLPGSLYHHNWKKAGVSNMDLVLGLVKLAEERFVAMKDTTYAFKSDILSKVGGAKAQK